jgi:hypothetical protein
MPDKLADNDNLKRNYAATIDSVGGAGKPFFHSAIGFAGPSIHRPWIAPEPAGGSGFTRLSSNVVHRR